MPVSEAARNFSRLVRRAERRASTIITRNGRPVARVVPAKPKAPTGRELAKIWPKLFHLTPEEAESFAADIDAGRKSLSPLVSPWEKY